MTPVEKRHKAVLSIFAALFVFIQIPFVYAWVVQQGGFWGMNAEFFSRLAHDPLYQVTAIDFTALTLLVFMWMIWDSLRRQHPWRAWLWLPVILISPTLGALGYLLTRRGWQFPIAAARRD